MWLTFRSGAEEGESVEAVGERFAIGRDPACDLVIADDRVSRRHAELRPRPDGRCELHDVGSANGTYVNGHLLSGPVLLAGGERLQLGDTVLTTSLEAPTGARTVAGATPEGLGAAPAPPPGPRRRRSSSGAGCEPRRASRSPWRRSRWWRPPWS